LQFQPGQVCQLGQVRKIRKTNFADLHSDSQKFTKADEDFSETYAKEVRE
jgi:hypothetical protein